MRQFHLVIHARPPSLPDGSPLDVRPGQLSLPLPISFDEICERLARLPRMFCEPDGSFVWVGQTSTLPMETWQIDGNLSDSPAGPMAVELKGRAPWPELERLLRCFSSQPDQMIFQLVQAAIFIGAADLKTHLSQPSQ